MAKCLILTTRRNTILSLFNKIVHEENIEKSYKQCMKGKSKYKEDAMVFDRDKTYNIYKLVESLKNGTYTMSGYIRFYVYEPKEREIYAPKFKDKLVQTMINNVIKETYNKAFIKDSYACIDNKGTHKASERINHFVKKAKWEYGEGAYIIKLDVSKFFYSINRETLKNLLPKKIKCKNTLNLMYAIIDSSPNELGIPLGNITSHILANVYMNEFDNYCKRNLRIRYYVRYMDDSFAVVKNKEAANVNKIMMEKFLTEVLQLNANPKKTKIFPINQGVNMVGFKTFGTHKLLRNDSKQKIKQKLRKMEGLILKRKMKKEKAEQMLNSWLGHSLNANSYNFIQKLLKKHDYIYLDSRGSFKINIEGVD